MQDWGKVVIGIWAYALTAVVLIGILAGAAWLCLLAVKTLLTFLGVA